MPKRKIRKAAKKRFKINKNGQVIHARSGVVIRGQRGKKIRKMLGG